MDNEKAEEGENEAPKTSSPAGSYQFLGQSKSGRKKFIITIGLILASVAAGWFAISVFLGTSDKKVQEEEITVEQTPTPAPTPQISLDRSDWPLEVLNGSGVSGLAKKIADQLKEQGYQVIKVGNAERDNYTETQIMVKVDLEDKINLVISDVKDIIKIASVGGELKNSTASARIIIGKD